jgi:hypothetical protein
MGMKITIGLGLWAVVIVIVYGSWIYNYLCNQCLSPLKLWVRTPFMWGIQHYVIKFVYLFVAFSLCCSWHQSTMKSRIHSLILSDITLCNWPIKVGLWCLPIIYKLNKFKAEIWRRIWDEFIIVFNFYR